MADTSSTCRAHSVGSDGDEDSILICSDQPNPERKRFMSADAMLVVLLLTIIVATQAVRLWLLERQGDLRKELNSIAISGVTTLFLICLVTGIMSGSSTFLIATIIFGVAASLSIGFAFRRARVKKENISGS